MARHENEIAVVGRPFREEALFSTRYRAKGATLQVENLYLTEPGDGGDVRILGEILGMSAERSRKTKQNCRGKEDFTHSDLQYVAALASLGVRGQLESSTRSSVVQGERTCPSRHLFQQFSS